jgi:hypothetical protein
MMMSLTRRLAAAATAALLAGPAFAGTVPAAAPALKTATDQRPSNDTRPMNPMSADDAATPTSARAADPSAPPTILLNSPTPPSLAWQLKAGDSFVVTNGPVPDTAENRTRYGAPISNGGRKTPPAGN